MSIRQMKRALADDRALEEQAERTNPINPKRQLGTRKGRTSLVAEGSEYTGSGATPSTGLSQFRGGAMNDGGSESGESLVGSGTKKGQRRKTARKAYEGLSEAHEMGKHLGSHLHSLHGAGFFDDFAKGFMSVIKPVASIAKPLLPMLGPEGAMASTALGAVGLGKKKRGKGKLTITHGGAMLGQDGHGTRQVGAGTGGMAGAGFLSDLGIPVISQLAGAIGLGKKGRKKGGKKKADYSGCGTGGMAGAGNITGPGYEALSGEGTGGMTGAGFISDLGIPIISNLAGAIGLGHGEYEGGMTGAGKGKRSDVVKQVMRERGVSMIEASKIVKQEGLY